MTEETVDTITVKISAGMSYLMNKDEGSNKLENWRWLAPELLSNMAIFDNFGTVHCDAYSFGLFLWELFTEIKPLSDVQQLFIRNKQLKVSALLLAIRNGLRPDKHESIPPKLFSLLEKCWKHETNERISFMEIITELYSIFSIPMPIFTGYTVQNKYSPQIIRINPEQAQKNSLLWCSEQLPYRVQCICFVSNCLWAGTRDGYIFVFSCVVGQFYS